MCWYRWSDLLVNLDAIVIPSITIFLSLLSFLAQDFVILWVLFLVLRLVFWPVKWFWYSVSDLILLR